MSTTRSTSTRIFRHPGRQVVRGFPLVGLFVVALVWPVQGHADEAFRNRLTGLAASEAEDVAAAVTQLAALGDVRALPVLEALYQDRLRTDGTGQIFIQQKGGSLVDPMNGKTVTIPVGLRQIEINNLIRRAVSPALSRLQLVAPDRTVRFTAAQTLARSGDTEAIETMRQILPKESDAQIRTVITTALARADLAHGDGDRRLQAVETLASTSGVAVKGEFEKFLTRNDDGSFVEPDERVRRAARLAVSSMERRELFVNSAGHVLYGLSLASVLLFAALGLAITFGVMGVINMAHGEMLTIGAYTTFVVQGLFNTYLPGMASLYLLAAIPAAFLVSMTVGIVMERSVIRFLYGRPLETLLATWGISLVIIQTIRLIFGAANVAVANPSWLEGGAELLTGLVLPWNRIAVVLFVVLAAVFVWLIMQKTRLGLQVRAVTQNRAMASCMGVRTKRVDMWTFGIGSGMAGLGGVALSQLGNVGPELGQAYIVDSFMVVVLGGVGRIAGTVGAALGLGMIQKFIEPISGAVLGKIAVLVLVILFIQRKPEGLFSLRGRVEA